MLLGDATEVFVVACFTAVADWHKILWFSPLLLAILSLPQALGVPLIAWVTLTHPSDLSSKLTSLEKPFLTLQVRYKPSILYPSWHLSELYLHGMIQSLSVFLPKALWAQKPFCLIHIVSPVPSTEPFQVCSRHSVHFVQWINEQRGWTQFLQVKNILSLRQTA